MNNKIENLSLKITLGPLFILIIFSLNIISVSALDSIDNLSIDFHSVSVIRKGYIFPASVTIRNLNENVTWDIKKVTILNDNKKIVKAEDINKNLKSVKRSLERGEELVTYLRKPEFCEAPELVKEQPEFEEYKNIYDEIKNETFRQSFRLDIRDFDSDPEIGDNITVLIEIEMGIGNEMFVINRENEIKIAPPLPAPPHNSPGWFTGDLHIHSEFGSTIAESPDPLPDMVLAADQDKGLDWVIFTDHSVAFSEASEWEDGYDACVANSTSSFKCLYGQEMSIGTPDWACDSLYNGHYLAYPYTDDNLGWIDGYCGLTYCYCRSEQPVMNEINNAGGMGFIAHPHNPDTAFTEYDWDNWSVTGFTGLQIINEEFTGDDGTAINNPGGNDDSWQEFLEAETNPDNGFIVGIGGSDAHTTDEVSEDRAFTYCYLNSLSTTNIRNAIKDGHCIVSTGPFVAFTLNGKIIGESANVLSGNNALSITANSGGFGNLEWLYIYVDEQVEDVIPLSGTSYSGTVNVSLDTSDDYIRLAVFTDEESGGYSYRAYTNPIWVNVTTCSCGSWSAGSCGGGSCSSSQKQYTRTCTPSACAAETTCIYDESCEEEGEGQLSDCEEPGYDQCVEYTYEDCDVSIAVNYYTNVNNIKWGVVNDAWDPYIINQYRIGWKGVDVWWMYYGNGTNETCEYGGCDGTEISYDEGTMVTVNAPGIATSEMVLGYDDSASYWCTVWFNPFNPSYIPGDNPIYVLNCFNDSDCSSSEYCDKSSSWSNWDCVSDKSDGQSCTRDAQCSSGYCDDDGVGLSDDNHCFTPYNTYFDGRENTYCEYSTGLGNSNCDERQSGADLSLCSLTGQSYYEDECSNTCAYQDVTSVFECTESGCSCAAPQCDGLTTGSNINTCTYGATTYFADKCTSTAGGEDRGDNICRNSSFAADCTAASNCNGLSTGTDLNTCNQAGQTYYEDECSNSCAYQDITNVFECAETGCSCAEPLCDGLTTGSDITTCTAGQTFFADECASNASGQDRGDNICRSSTFVAGCTADSVCNGVTAGTGNCTSTCSYNAPLQNITSVNVTDPEGNLITIENKAEVNENVTFSVSLSTLFIDYFNNSLTAENLTFSGNENITKHLKIKKEAVVTISTMNISGINSGTSENFTEDFNRPNNDTVGNGWTDTSSSPADSDIENNQLHQFFATGNGYATIYRNLTFIPENFTIDFNITFTGANYTYYLNRFELYNNTGGKFAEAEYRVTNWTLRDCSASSANFCITFYGNNTVGSWNRNVSADLVSVGVNLGDFVKLTYTMQSGSHWYNQKPNVWSDNVYLSSGSGIFYPTNPRFEIGTPDGASEWNHTGEYNTNEQTSDLSLAINNYLAGCTPDAEGNCAVPFIFHSDSAGILKYSDIRINYTPDVDSVWVVLWNTTKQAGIKFIEAVMSYEDGVWKADIYINNSFPPIINYTVYTNNSMNNIASFDGNFSVSKIANETEGRTAIEQGINNSVISGQIIFTDYYMRYLNESRDVIGLFDKITEELNQTWAFNYVTAGESFTNMGNLTEVVYVLELANKTTADITLEVEAFINATKG